MMKKIRKLLVQFIHQFVEGDVPTSVSALSFSTLLAIVPFIATVLATLKIVGALDFLYPKLESFLLTSVAGPVGQQSTQAIHRIISRLNPAKLGGIGLFTLLFTSVFLLRDVENAIHRVWSEKNTRPFYKRFFVYWLLLLLTPVVYAVLFSLSTMSTFSWLTDHFPGWLNQVVFFTALLFCLNKIIPALKVKLKAALIGSIFSATLLVLLIQFFSQLTTKILNYSKFYGGLAAFPTFLIWIFLTWYCVLAGVALTASFHEENANARVAP